MGYTVPLRFIRVSQKRSDNRQHDVAICATRIVAIMSTQIFQARKTIAEERRNGTLINGCGLVKAKSAIFLDNGSVVSSPLTVKKLMSLIDKSNEKAGTRLDRRMRVYDVYDGNASDDEEEEFDDEEESEDMSAAYEEYEEDEYDDLDM